MMMCFFVDNQYFLNRDWLVFSIWSEICVGIFFSVVEIKRYFYNDIPKGSSRKIMAGIKTQYLDSIFIRNIPHSHDSMAPTISFISKTYLDRISGIDCVDYCVMEIGF